MSDKKTFKNEFLTLELDEMESGYKLQWLGKSVEREPGKFLNPLLSNLLMEGKKNNKRITVIFNGLSYMNSSTIMTISKFLEKGKDGNSQITICYDGERRWQKMSFNALKIFQTNDGKIIFEGNKKA